MSVQYFLRVCLPWIFNYVRKTERKTERIFHERHRKHVQTDKDSIINNHLDECDRTKYLFSLCHLNSGLKASKDVQIYTLFNMNQLIFSEAGCSQVFVVFDTEMFIYVLVFLGHFTRIPHKYIPVLLNGILKLILMVF